MTSPHLHQIRVRYAETDQMGVAHHSAYVDWLEEARIEFMRSRGIVYCELEGQGILMPVIELKIDYKRSLRFDDVVEFATTVEVKGPGRLTFTTDVKARAADASAASAQVTVVATSREGKPVRLPQHIAQLLAKVDPAL